MSVIIHKSYILYNICSQVKSLIKDFYIIFDNNQTKQDAGQKEMERIILDIASYNRGCNIKCVNYVYNNFHTSFNLYLSFNINF